MADQGRAEEVLVGDARQAVAKALLTLIETISEEYWRAGWFSDIEFSLWSHVNDGPKQEGYAADDLAPLPILAGLVGGWWTWNRGDVAPSFVEMSDWLPVYDAWAADYETRYGRGR